MAEHESSGPAKVHAVPPNPFVSNMVSDTLENVASVLSYLSSSRPIPGLHYEDAQELGRMLILDSCAEALRWHAATVDKPIDPPDTE